MGGRKGGKTTGKKRKETEEGKDGEEERRGENKGQEANTYSSFT